MSRFDRTAPKGAMERTPCVLPFLALPVLLYLLLFACVALCEPRSDDDASTVVAQWLRLDGAPLSARLGGRVAKVVPLRNSAGTVFAYSVHLNPAGFVIVPADDEVEPVLAFSPGTEFKLSNDNPLGALVLHDVAGRVDMARRDRMSAAPGKARARPPHVAEASAKWNLLRDRLPLLDAPAARDGAIVLMGMGFVSDPRVDPFILSKWDQGNENGIYCYNYYTPNHDPCGCVATAMGQWMRYFERPTFGVGTNAFSVKVDSTWTTRNLRGGDGIGGPYAWSNMPLDPDAFITPTQREAIGALCHDAGVAAHMQYTAGASGAFSEDALAALTNTFGYSSGAYGCDDGRDLSGTPLNAMINPNLHAKQPVMLGILRDGVYGHAVLCDGYGYSLGTLYHHLNMGWSGSYDYWYSLPTIDPPGRTYTSVFECVYNVYTSGVGEIVSGRITNSSGAAVTGVVVTAQNEAGAAFTGISDTRGVYAIVNVPSSDRYRLSACRAGYAFTNMTIDVRRSKYATPLCGNVWGMDFRATSTAGPGDPAAFAAWPKSGSRIDLQWRRNSSNDNVLLAWSGGGAFGAPSGAFNPGDPIAGGGAVLYVGNATNFSHSDLIAGAVHHYRAWSVDANTNYSAGSQLAAATHATYYVNDASGDGDVWCAATGSDAAAGTSSNAPKATVQAVLDAYDVEPGDAIFVDTGSYVLTSNTVIAASDQGSRAYHVAIRGSPNGTEFDRNNGTNGAYGLYLNRAGYVDLYDLSFTGGYWSVYAYDADGCILSNLAVRGSTNCGIYLNSSSYNLLEGVRVAGCGSNGIHSIMSEGNVFANGTVWSNRENGLDLRYSGSNLVVNCTFAFNASNQVCLSDAWTVLFLTNSILVASGSESRCVYWTNGTYAGDYNDLYAVGGAAVGYSNGVRSSLTAWRSVTGQDSHSLGEDPCFCDWESGDFHLKSTAGSWHGGTWAADATNSPAIDTGLPALSCSREPAPNGGYVNMGACGNTPQASKSADTDCDGVSDSFEVVRLGSNPRLADSDADGMDDGNELVAGTDPTNPVSVFAIAEVVNPDPARAEVRWYSVTNRAYAIDRATNLMAGGFAAVTNNLAATPPVNVYTDIVEGLGNILFYRIKTQP